MLATAKTPGRLLFGLFDLAARFHLTEVRGSLEAQPPGPSLDQATAHLPPHMLVDIGLAAPSQAGTTAAPIAQPLVPPVSALHRRGDWGGHSLGRHHADPDEEPIPITWTWPQRH